MPGGKQNRPEHAQARRRAPEAIVRGLVAGAAAEAHTAHALPDLTGSARAFLGEAALPAVWALNGAGSLRVLPAMHRIVKGVRPGLVEPRAVLYGSWMEGRKSNQSGRPLSMGDALRLTSDGSATSLHSSTPALLHALRTRLSMDETPYLNQARDRYPGAVSELNAALHLLHPADEDPEVGEVTIFVEGRDKTPPRPRPTNPLYDGAVPTPPYSIPCEAFPRGAHLVPHLRSATHAPRSWAHPRLSPPLSRTRGANHRGQVLWQEHPVPPLLLPVLPTRGDPERVLGATPTSFYGAAPVPRPPFPAPKAPEG